MKDPLDMFNAGADRDMKDYPGNTVPRNRAGGIRPPTSNLVALLDTAPFKVYHINGVETPCYTIGAVSRVLGRDPITIRSWEQKGWLPKPKIRTRPPDTANLPGKPAKGRRLYTKAQVLYLIDGYERFSLDSKVTADYRGFISYLKQYPTT